MADEWDTERRRIRRLVGDVVFPLLYPETVPLEVAVHRVAGEPIPPAEALAADFEPFFIGQTWGGAWSTAWFRLSGTVPEGWAGREVVARIMLGYYGMEGFGGEGLLFLADRPLQGINSRHNEATVIAEAVGGEHLELHLEAAANPAPPYGTPVWPLLMPDYEGFPLYRLDRAELSVADRELESAWTDVRILAELADALPASDARAIEIVRCLDAVARSVVPGDARASFLAQRHRFEPLLAVRSASRHLVTAVGHAHIDSAWLWPVRETRRKCARTFSTALRLMEENPDFVFVCSQAQQHAWMLEHYPQLFAELKEKAASGQFEPVGSMWVEPDTNLPSGESLVRQLVFGKRFFLEHYGIETEDCWLPDAFGYSGSLPQILRSAGVRYFLTQKLSWNQVNRFPHHTFWWEGIDGTRVLAHCPPTDTYNGDFSVSQLLAGDAAFAEHGISRRSLYAYGFGDGGGGPHRFMLDAYRRLGDLEPLPRIELGTAAGFFGSVEAEAMEAEREAAEAAPGTVATAHAPGPGGLPVWAGELYLERHRAVQTTQGRVKLGNRRSEDLLREAELWAVAGKAGEAAHASLAHAWQIVLLHQFHDMLPGSSIHWVHEDSRAAYATIETLAESLIAESCGSVATTVGGGDGPYLVVFNTASHEQEGLVEIEPSVLAGLGASGRDDAGGLVAAGVDDEAPVPVQRLESGRLGFLARVPGCGWARYDLHHGSPVGDTAAATAVVEADGPAYVLSNGCLRARVEADGTLSSLEDRTTGRQLIAAGSRGNVFQLHVDQPTEWDAWDVDPGAFARAVELGEPESFELIENGPVRAAVRLSHRFGESRLVQDIRLVAGSRRLEFATEVEWAERHRFLKVAFPLAVRAAAATYEIQFGYLQRPTHANTSWDAARFEVPAQRWADLSEPGCGLALLNDCKYGYDVHGSVMRLSLLRGPTWPDPRADLGTHRFAYALLPHEGLAAALRRPGSVTDEAEGFNLGLRAVAVPGGQAPPPLLPARGSVVEVTGAMLSAVKQADDGNGIIVRFYESAGAHLRATVRLGTGAGGPLEAATRTDSLERDGEPLPLGEGGAVELDLRPFELVTLRLSPSRLAAALP